MSAPSMLTCDLCGGNAGPYGNNPHPLIGTTCCDTCNTTKVLPARINAMFSVPAKTDYEIKRDTMDVMETRIRNLREMDVTLSAQIDEMINLRSEARKGLVATQTILLAYLQASS